MAIGKNLMDLQAVLGYSFRDLSLLENAMTHASYANEQHSRGNRHIRSNQRLEFLGDAVLQAVISEHLYRTFPAFGEGDLTRARRALVCTQSLYETAKELCLCDYLNIGNGEEHTGCRTRPKVMADATEALFGALYLDCRDLSRVGHVILTLFGGRIEAAMHPRDDEKTRLQQLVEKEGTSVLEYELVQENGPAHRREFTVCAKINNNEVGRGVASTKKDAQMLAARAALSLFGLEK